MAKAPSSLIVKLTFGYFKAFRNTFFLSLKIFGSSRRRIINTFLYGLIRPLWNLMPESFTNITFQTQMGKNKINFRPFILHDFLFVLSNHEPLFQERFNPEPASVVIDVGAHIGIYTIKAASAIGEKGKVISIEPDPRNYVLLKKNIRLNDLSNVIPINAALSNFHGEKLFYPCKDPSLSGLQPSSESQVCKPKLTKIYTLDELIQIYHIPEINWLKIDVEGEEQRVLEGGINALQSSKHLSVMIESDNDRSAKFLKAIGFSVQYLGELYYFASKGS